METKNEGLSIAFLLYDFFEYTSMHGAGRIVASRQWIRKIFWIMLMLSALGISSWQIQQLYSMYRKKPINTRVDIAHDTNLSFPTITICDTNALRYDEVSASLRKLFEQRSPSLNSSAENEEVEDDEDKQVKDREFLLAKMAEQDEDELQRVGHQFEDFVIHCTFNGFRCTNFSSWKRYWHHAYGNCYVFNGGTDDQGESTQIEISNEPGPLNGINLELNIEQGQYIGALTQEAGVKIDISDQGQMPFPLEKGLSLAPGFATSIGIRKVVINRLDPFSNDSCITDSRSDTDEINLYKNIMKVNYSTTACRKTCWAWYQRDKCGCVHYKLPRPKDTRVCDMSNETEKECLKKEKADLIQKLNCSKQCPPPCRENTFKLTTSYSLWPTETSERYYKKQLEKLGKYVDDSEDFRANILKVNVFFEELNYEVISQELAYSLPNFMSDLGGSLGLWIGMSVLTVAEIFEFILLLCYTLARKLKKSSTITVEKFQAE